MRNIAMVGLFVTATAHAAPGSVAHSGRLLDTDGAPLQGEQALTFLAYAAPTGGSALWSEPEAVSVDGGYYSVLLGDDVAFPDALWDGSVRYLEVRVGGVALTPRTPIHAVPYALNATGDLTPTSIDVSGAVRARSGVQLDAVLGSCPGVVPAGTMDYQAGSSSVRVCTAGGWVTLGERLDCPSGWWRVNDGKLCVEMAIQPATDAHSAIKECRDSHGARVCTHNDLQLACGYGINPYAGSATGWYGDHARSETVTSPNTDDEYLTWNRAVCDANGNNDGPALQATELEHAYRCCR